MKYIHDLTYWTPLDKDRYGNPTWSAPSQIECRWEDVIKRFRNNDGEIDVSRSEIMVPIKLVPGVYVLRGKHYDTSPPQEALKVKSYREVSNVRGNKTDRVIIL